MMTGGTHYFRNIRLNHMDDFWKTPMTKPGNLRYPTFLEAAGLVKWSRKICQLAGSQEKCLELLL